MAKLEYCSLDRTLYNETGRHGFSSFSSGQKLQDNLVQRSCGCYVSADESAYTGLEIVPQETCLKMNQQPTINASNGFHGRQSK